MAVPDGITISQAASFAGVTVKTIRHYHQHGLIAEPGRDSSGYRRYRSADLLRLVQVRTLAVAGVPLAEIGAILDADPSEFGRALADVEDTLTARIDELVERRETLRRLANGQHVLLPESACALLEKLPSLGFTPEDVTTAQEAFILVKAVAPESLEGYLVQIQEGLDDPHYLSLVKLNLRAGDLAADDPRVDEIAHALADHFIANPSLLPSLAGLEDHDDADTRRALLSRHGEDQKPAWARMTRVIEARLRAAGVETP